MTYVSICTDFAQLIADFPELVDPEGSKMGGKLRGWSGDYTIHNGNQSMKILTAIDGLDSIAEKDYIVVTTYEEIFGYRRQVEVDGVLQWAEPTIATVPAYTPQVVVGYEDDLDSPIYVVNRVETPTTRTVTDEEGNTFEVAGRPTIEYVTTDEIEGYHQKPIYGPGEEIPAQVIETPNPVMEEVQGDSEIKALYDSIYDQSPVTDEDGNVHTPSRFFAIPGGYSVEHIL